MVLIYWHGFYRDSGQVVNYAKGCFDLLTKTARKEDKQLPLVDTVFVVIHCPLAKNHGVPEFNYAPLQITSAASCPGRTLPGCALPESSGVSPCGLAGAVVPVAPPGGCCRSVPRLAVQPYPRSLGDRTAGPCRAMAWLWSLLSVANISCRSPHWLFH